MPLDEPQEDGNDLVLYLGDDWRGVPLEVMGIELASMGISLDTLTKEQQAYLSGWEHGT